MSVSMADRMELSSSVKGSFSIVDMVMGGEGRWVCVGGRP